MCVGFWESSSLAVDCKTAQTKKAEPIRTETKGEHRCLRDESGRRPWYRPADFVHGPARTGSQRTLHPRLKGVTGEGSSRTPRYRRTLSDPSADLSTGMCSCARGGAVTYRISLSWRCRRTPVFTTDSTFRLKPLLDSTSLPLRWVPQKRLVVVVEIAFTLSLIQDFPVSVVRE